MLESNAESLLNARRAQLAVRAWAAGEGLSREADREHRPGHGSHSPEHTARAHRPASPSAPGHPHHKHGCGGKHAPGACDL